MTFALLGSGDQFPILQALARELRIEAYVVFTGYVESNELMRYLSTADVGLAPDPQNGLNEYLTTIKVMEYIAVGLPVVAFDLKETRRSADDAALYAVPNDIDAFSQHFAALLDDPELRSALGDRGRERVQKHLAWDYSREQLILAYQQAVDRV